MRGLKAIFNFLLPPRCGCCGEILDEPHNVCPTCWGKIDFISDPLCVRCGRPFSFDIEDDLECGACQQHPPAFDQARSVFLYGEGARTMLLRYKHSDALYLTPLFGKWLSPLVGAMATPEAVVVPVPLHWTRLFWRTYNQAGVLAKQVAGDLRLPFDPFSLYRTRRTAPQGQGDLDRHDNVKNAFRVKSKDAFKGKDVILIDDVYTTGSTLEACCRVLRQAGARSIKCVTLARVHTTK